MAASGVAKYGAIPAAAGTTTGAVGDGVAVVDGAGSDGLAATVADCVDTGGLATTVGATTADTTSAGLASTAVVVAGAFELAQPASARPPRAPARVVAAARAKSGRGARVCVCVIRFPRRQGAVTGIDAGGAQLVDTDEIGVSRSTAYDEVIPNPDLRAFPCP